MEQDLRVDPVTGFRLSDPRNQDSKQNLNYVRHTDPQDTARDYSRPHTIPAEEFEAATGRKHDEAVAEFKHNEDTRIRDAELAAHRQADALRAAADRLDR